MARKSGDGELQIPAGRRTLAAGGPALATRRQHMELTGFNAQTGNRGAILRA